MDRPKVLQIMEYKLRLVSYGNPTNIGMWQKLITPYGSADVAKLHNRIY